jgi:SAM-dependent methyltransferase
MEPLRLMCPRCNTLLAWAGGERLECRICGTCYPVERGIPIIRAKNDYYHELMTKEQLRRILARSQEVGWRSALAEQWAEESDQRRSVQSQILLDESRAAFKVLLPPLTDCRVLDLGCGSGSTAINLSRNAKEVIACDLTFERVAFLAVRANDLGLANLRVVCAGDTIPLPFPDSNFDCVILNGVLEWSAGDGKQPVRDAQLEFLRQVRRVLKPDGQIYIGIENRFGYHYFLGAREDHTGVRFASVAPRFLADLLVRKANGRPYRTYTYGYTGYRCLLRDAGFADVRVFSPLPDYRQFDELVSLNGNASPGKKAERTWRKRVKNYLEHSRRFSPSFGIVAGSRAVQTSWAEALAEHVRKSLGLKSTSYFPTIRVSASSSAGLIMGMDGVFIRVDKLPIVMHPKATAQGGILRRIFLRRIVYLRRAPKSATIVFAHRCRATRIGYDAQGKK